MREEMASSSSLCVYLCLCVWEQACAFADHTLDHNRPRSLQREQIVPPFFLMAGYIPPLPRNIERNKLPWMTSQKISGRAWDGAEKAKKNMVEGWVVVSFGWGGGEAKNKTGDEERKWKEMSAKIVMRHYNHTGLDEEGKLEQRRIEKETQTGRGEQKDRERKWEDRKREWVRSHTEKC